MKMIILKLKKKEDTNMFKYFNKKKKIKEIIQNYSFIKNIQYSFFNDEIVIEYDDFNITKYFNSFYILREYFLSGYYKNLPEYDDILERFGQTSNEKFKRKNFILIYEDLIEIDYIMIGDSKYFFKSEHDMNLFIKIMEYEKNIKTEEQIEIDNKVKEIYDRIVYERL